MPVDVFPGSSILFDGKLPSVSLLLLGPSGIGKTVFCKQFLYNGLIVSQPCIYVATDESPEQIRESMKSFGFDIEPYEEDGTFRIIDCYSWKLGCKSSNEYTVNNPTDIKTLSMTIDKALRGLKKYKIRLVLDSITGLSSIYNHNLDSLSKFLKVTVSRIRWLNSYTIRLPTPVEHNQLNNHAIFTATPEAHDQQFLSSLRLTFDGTLEIKEDEKGKEIKRLLRISSLKGAKHKTHWIPFEITNRGITIKK